MIVQLPCPSIRPSVRHIFAFLLNRDWIAVNPTLLVAYTPPNNPMTVSMSVRCFNALSGRRSVGPSVCQSVSPLLNRSVTLLFRRLNAFIATLPFPKCLVGQFHHCSCPLTRDLVIHVSGRVSLSMSLLVTMSCVDYMESRCSPYLSIFVNIPISNTLSPLISARALTKLKNDIACFTF